MTCVLPYSTYCSIRLSVHMSYIQYILYICTYRSTVCTRTYPNIRSLLQASTLFTVLYLNLTYSYALVRSAPSSACLYASSHYRTMGHTVRFLHSMVHTGAHRWRERERNCAIPLDKQLTAMESAFVPWCIKRRFAPQSADRTRNILASLLWHT